MCKILISLFAVCYSIVSFGQAKYRLPMPGGPYPVGTTTNELSTNIKDPFAISHNFYLKIPIQFWYPASPDTGTSTAAYSPLFKETDSIITNSFYRRSFFDSLSKAPVVLICAGRGMTKHEYSMMAEDLASHGYIVVAFDMPYIGTTKLMDGNLIKSASQFRMPSAMFSGPYEKVDSFYEAASLLGTKYVNAVVDFLISENKSGISLFYKKIDLSNIGIFGHSLGGRIAGQAIADNKLIKAYISMEGIAPRNIRINGISKPMAYMLSEGIVKNAISNYEQSIPGRKGKIIIITLKDYGHNSFTDLPFTSPATINYPINAADCLATNRLILLTFFNEHLRSKGSCEKEWGGNKFISSKFYY